MKSPFKIAIGKVLQQ